MIRITAGNAKKSKHPQYKEKAPSAWQHPGALSENPTSTKTEE